MIQVFYIFIGGGIGSVMRYGISVGMKTMLNTAFPLATLLANLLSCFIMGLTLNYMAGKTDAGDMRLFILTGICGGFSTFSTFSLETLELFRKGMTMYASLNILISFVSCILILSLLIKK